MNGKLGIIVVIIAIAGGWYLLSGNTAKGLHQKQLRQPLV